MQKKEFKSRLFRRIIGPGDREYWELLYAEVLYRAKALDDLNCSCTFCFRERIQMKNLLREMMEDGHIPENPKPKNFTGKGNCGRSAG